MQNTDEIQKTDDSFTPGHFMRFKGKFNNEKYSLISRYVVLTVVVIFVIIQILWNLDVIFSAIGFALGWLNVLLKPLFIGFAIAYVFFPFVDFFEKQLGKLKPFKKSPPRRLATLITWLLLVLIIVLLSSMLLSALTKSLSVMSISKVDELIQSLANVMNNFYTSVSARLAQLNIPMDDVNTYLQEVGMGIANFFKDLSTNLTGGITQVGSFFTNLVFAIVFSIYFILDGRKMMGYWDRVLKAFTKEKTYTRVHLFLEDADNVFSGYIRGTLMDVVFMMFAASISLSIVGVNYSVIIGIMTGVGNLIPYLGPFIAYVGTILVCLMDGDFTKMFIAIIVILVVQTIDGNVVEPKFMAHAIEVHPILIIAALITGGATNGLVGMLFAIPVAALLKIWFDRFTSWRIKKKSEKAPMEESGSYEKKS